MITNGTVITMAEAGIIPDGLVLIKDGAIVWVGPRADSTPTLNAVRTIDAAGGFILPGLINTHVHAPMTCFRGLSDDQPLMRWLEDYIFPAEARFVTPEMTYLGAKLAILEMIASGTTTFADGYFCEDGVVKAALEAGIRAMPAQGVVDFPAPGVSDPARNVTVAQEFLSRWQGVSDLVHPAVFCHSCYTCGPDTLQRAKDLARRQNTLFFIHLAETKDEVSMLQQAHGVTPVRYLKQLGILDRSTVGVHLIHIDEADIADLAMTGTAVASAPESNMKLASGVAPVVKMLAQGLRLGLGTDGCASNNDLDMLAEMDTMAKLHKVTCGDPTVLPAEQVVSLATIEAARVLGLDDRIGSLEMGKRADLIVLEINRPHLTPVYHPYSALVFAARGSDVRHVIIDGRVVYDNYAFTTLDAKAVMAEVTSLAGKIGAGLNIS
ncbi:MAG: amidohydrolase [Deltaproteobacteria bacterium]|nr:amidohydrolase [Deltaproteobacteria bacterium]